MNPAPALEGQPVEAPELDPLEQAKQEYGEHFEQLPEQLVNALREQVKEFQQQEKFLRRREVMRDRRNRFYERGVQHIYWNAQGNSPGFTGITAGGTTTNAAGQMVQAPNYCDDYNIYRRYLQINMAILTQTPAGIDFKPDDAGQSDDIEAAETAELYRHDFDRNNDVAALRQNTVRMFGVSGRTIRWTRTEANAQRYGTVPGPPDETGQPTKVPKRVEISTVHGTLESKVPILAKCQDDALYCFLADDPDVKQMKAEYPDFADKIKAGVAGLGENAYERLARLGVLQGSNSSMLSADSYTHLVTRTNCWMRPNSFTGDRYDEPFEGEQGVKVGEKLKELFPEGCRAVFVGDVYVESCPEAIEDCLCIEFPWEGDGMNREGFMDSFLVVQDSFNDAMNAAREVFDVGWPSTWVSAEDTEFDTIVGQRSDPYALRQMKDVPNGSKVSDRFFREPNPELPATFVEFMQDLQGPLPQFMLAAPPALFGASMEDQKTASGYAQARAQAMGQQGLIYAKLQKMDAVMYQQAAILASNNPQQATRTIQVPGGPKAEIDLGKLTKGHFKCFPANDSNLPESTAAKRSTIDNVLLQIGNTPIGMQMMQAPKNMRIYLDTHGLNELVIPEAEAYDQELAVIDRLLEESPLPADPAMQDQANIDHAAATVKARAMGQPEEAIPPTPVLPPTCSIPPEEYEFHQWAAQADQDWLNSEDCRRELKNGNDAGVQNVVLRWKAHLAMIPPPMPMVAPPGDAPPGGKPGGSPAPAGGPLLPQSVQTPGAPGMATM